MTEGKLAFDGTIKEVSIGSNTIATSLSPARPYDQATLEELDDDEPSFEDLLSDVNGNVAAHELCQSLQPALEMMGYLEPDSNEHSSSFGDRGPHTKIAGMLSDASRALKQRSRRNQGNPAFFELTQTLAVLSRSELWASAFNEYGILDLYLDILSPTKDKSSSWVDSGIRLIANCCTRSPRTKRKVFSRAPLGLLVQGLQRRDEATLSIMAISAICSGVDEAIEELERSHQLTSLILTGLRSNFYEIQHMDVLFELVEAATTFIDLSMFEESHLGILLESPHKFELSQDNIIMLSPLLLRLLEEARLCHVIFQRDLSLLLTFFLNTYAIEISDSLAVDALAYVESPEHAQQATGDDIERLRKAIISNLEKFTKVISDLQPLHLAIGTLVTWLNASKQTIQVFACVFFGNVAFHVPHSSQLLLQKYGLGSSLSRCLAAATDHAVLTSAMDMLQNIATMENRKMLGDAGLLGRLMNRVTRLDMLSGRALLHVRQLLHECPSNALIFVGAADPVTTEVADMQTTMLGQLLATFSRADERALIAETGQVVAEIWRTLHQSGPLGRQKDRVQQEHRRSSDLPVMKDLRLDEVDSSTGCLLDQAAQSPIDCSISGSINEEPAEQGSTSSAEVEVLLRMLFEEFKQPSIIEPVVWLLGSGNESLISTGWFVLSLMAMSRSGATAVYLQVIENAEHHDLLKRTLQGLTGQAGAKNNALYLVATLQEQLVCALPESWPTDMLMIEL